MVFSLDESGFFSPSTEPHHARVSAPVTMLLGWVLRAASGLVPCAGGKAAAAALPPEEAS